MENRVESDILYTWLLRPYFPAITGLCIFMPLRFYSRSQTESIASSPHEEGGNKDISSRKVGGRWPQFKDSGGGT